VGRRMKQYLILLPQSSSNIPPLFFSEYDPAIRGIHSNSIIQITDILVQHIETCSKGRPSPPSHSVGMAYSMDIWPRLVDLRVDEEPCGVCCFALRSSQYKLRNQMMERGGYTLFPPTTLPVLTSRQIKSPAVINPKCFPRGFIQIYSGNSGSRTEM
jgi:hypothetical protein